MLTNKGLVLLIIVLSFALVVGTSIVSAVELITNTGLEAGNASGWSVNGAGTIAVSTAQKHAGTYSLYYTGRTATWNGPLQNITSKVQSGMTYQCSGWVKLDNATSDTIIMTIKKTDGSGTTYTNIATGTGSNSSWLQLSGSYTLTVSGTLSELSIYFEGPASGISMYLDDVSVSDGVNPTPTPTLTPTSTPTVITYPTLSGAVRSSLYTVTANGTSLYVEKLTKFSPEMQVHYAHCSLSGTSSADFAVTCNENYSSFKLSPKSRNISTSRSGNTVSFTSGPNYLVFQPDSKELLFIFIDSEEVNPPKLGDSNVKNIIDYGVDNTGATLVTSKIQSAINAASGATQNVLYFPPGKYLVGELWLKSNMTLYLAGGAVLYGSNNPNDFNTGSGGVNIEGCSHGMIRMYQISNTKILGRGVIDGNGKSIRAQNDTKINLLKIEGSSNILIDGIIVRDPSFWNTLPYRSNYVTIQNYKMINCRPTTTTYNNTDGVDFDESTNGYLYNAFLYTGDDSMAVKNEYADSGTINTNNIVHEKIVCYSNSVGCKIGTKTMGSTMTGVVFRDVDIVKAGRALNIDAYDTAVVSNTKFENIRIEAADSSIIALEEDDPPTWRTCANQSIIRDTYFTNVSAAVKKVINLHGRNSTYNINGVYFNNLTVQGNPVTSRTDSDASWSINSYVSNITFDNNTTPTPTPTPGSGTTYEAETGTTLTNSVVETTNSGYIGTGYVNFNASTGAAIQWNNINCTTTGTKNVTFRYALVSGTRNLDVYVNGTKVMSNAAYTATGNWTTWGQKTIQLTMNSGTNTLKIVTTGTEGPNIDSVNVSSVQ